MRFDPLSGINKKKADEKKVKYQKEALRPKIDVIEKRNKDRALSQRTKFKDGAELKETVEAKKRVKAAEDQAKKDREAALAENKRKANIIRLQLAESGAKAPASLNKALMLALGGKPLSSEQRAELFAFAAQVNKPRRAKEDPEKNQASQINAEITDKSRATLGNSFAKGLQMASRGISRTVGAPIMASERFNNAAGLSEEHLRAQEDVMGQVLMTLATGGGNQALRMAGEGAQLAQSAADIGGISLDNNMNPAMKAGLGGLAALGGAAGLSSVAEAAKGAGAGAQVAKRTPSDEAARALNRSVLEFGPTPKSYAPAPESLVDPVATFRPKRAPIPDMMGDLRREIDARVPRATKATVQAKPITEVDDSYARLMDSLEKGARESQETVDAIRRGSLAPGLIADTPDGKYKILKVEVDDSTGRATPLIQVETPDGRTTWMRDPSKWLQYVSKESAPVTEIHPALAQSYADFGDAPPALKTDLADTLKGNKRAEFDALEEQKIAAAKADRQAAQDQTLNDQLVASRRAVGAPEEEIARVTGRSVDAAPLAVAEPQTNTLVESAKSRFGVTNNPSEAGYITPEGEMLDFSGRHEVEGRFKKDFDGVRYSDHRDVSQVMEGSIDGTSAMLKFMGDTGSVRVSLHSGGELLIDLTAPPTIKQWSTIKKMASKATGITFEISDPLTGRSLWSKTGDVNKSADASRIFNEAKRVLDERFPEVPGAKPIATNTTEAPNVTSVTPEPTPMATGKPLPFDAAKLDSDLAAATERLRQKMGRVSSGIDPEILADVAEIAVIYMKKGVNGTVSLSRAVVEHLRSIGIEDITEDDIAEMVVPEARKRFDAESMVDADLPEAVWRPTRKVARLEKEIADLEQQLETGEFKDKPAKGKETNAKILELRERRRELKREIEMARPTVLKNWRPKSERGYDDGGSFDILKSPRLQEAPPVLGDLPDKAFDVQWRKVPMDAAEEIRAMPTPENLRKPRATEQLRSGVRAFRLADPVNRLMDLSSNALNLIDEVPGRITIPGVGKSANELIDRAIFPSLYKKQGAAFASVTPQELGESVKAATAKARAEIARTWREGADAAELEKYGIRREAPGVLRYVGRATGMTDIPFRALIRDMTAKELTKLGKLSDDEIQMIADEEALRAVFANENFLSERVLKHLESGMEEMGALGDIGGIVWDLAVPFPKILANIAGRSTDYAMGVAKIPAEMARAKSNLLRLGLADTSLPVQNRRIIVSLVRRNLVGTALLYLGYQFGSPMMKELDSEGRFTMDQEWVQALGPMGVVVSMGARLKLINDFEEAKLAEKRERAQAGVDKAQDAISEREGRVYKSSNSARGYVAGQPMEATERQLETLQSRQDEAALVAKEKGRGLASVGLDVVKDTAMDQPAFSGVEQMFRANDQDKLGDKFAKMAASAIIPAVIRNAARRLDTEGGRPKVEGLEDAFKANIPGLRSQLPRTGPEHGELAKIGIGERKATRKKGESDQVFKARAGRQRQLIHDVVSAYFQNEALARAYRGLSLGEKRREMLRVTSEALREAAGRY